MMETEEEPESEEEPSFYFIHVCTSLFNLFNIIDFAIPSQLGDGKWI